MSYYDNQEVYEAKGIDYDLGAAWEYNQSEFKFTLDDIQEVIAVHEGENEADDWRWLIRTNDNTLWYVKAGCDYTGWDCQSWVYACTPIQELNELDAIDDTVIPDLKRQLLSKKSETWRESMDKLMNVENTIDLSELLTDKDSKELPKIEITGLGDDSIDNLTIPTSGLLVDFQAEARERQRMLDEALVQTVIRVIRENDDLRRELRQAFGLED